MPSDASKEWSGTIKELEQKRAKIKRLIKHHMSEHKKLDANEPLGDARIKRAQQATKTLTAAFEKIDHFLKTHEPRMGTSRKKKK